MIDTGFCNGQTKSVHSGYCKRLMPEQVSWWMDGVNSKPNSTPSTKTCSNPWVASTICPTITEIQTAMVPLRMILASSAFYLEAPCELD